MKLLVLAEIYPMNGEKVCPMYIHMRNKYYAEHGADVTVLNFRANRNDVYDGIPVITLEEYKNKYQNVKFDLLVAHAANLKHHYRFIKKYGHLFPKYVFVFHGHEVLRKSTVYPKLFDWKKQKNVLSVKCRDVYDTVKLRKWKSFFESPSVIEKSHLIFVSQWMQDEFFKNTHTDIRKLEGHLHIAYNSVGRIFEENHYEPGDMKYDFVTIRRNIDGEKYCVDVVNQLAKANPQYRFLVVGRGELFSHISKADNLEWQDRNLYHNEMLDVLNHCRFALMPTKTDAQGLMMCEMASFGIPVITSDIPVCHEVLDDFDNAGFISNEGNDDLKPLVERLEPVRLKTEIIRDKFFEDNTSGLEFHIIESILK